MGKLEVIGNIIFIGNSKSWETIGISLGNYRKIIGKP
jgi:hypothetical protein